MGQPAPHRIRPIFCGLCRARVGNPEPALPCPQPLNGLVDCSNKLLMVNKMCVVLFLG